LRIALLGTLPEADDAKVTRRCGGWVGTTMPKVRLLSRPAYRAIERGRFRNFVQPTLEMYDVSKSLQSVYNIPTFTVSKAAPEQNIVTSTVAIAAQQWGFEIRNGADTYYTSIDVGTAMFPIEDDSIGQQQAERRWLVFDTPDLHKEHDLTRAVR
jgi:hypothetical protein